MNVVRAPVRPRSLSALPQSCPCLTCPRLPQSGHPGLPRGRLPAPVCHGSGTLALPCPCPALPQTQATTPTRSRGRHPDTRHPDRETPDRSMCCRRCCCCRSSKTTDQSNQRIELQSTTNRINRSTDQPTEAATTGPTAPQPAHHRRLAPDIDTRSATREPSRSRNGAPQDRFRQNRFRQPTPTRSTPSPPRRDTLRCCGSRCVHCTS